MVRKKKPFIDKKHATTYKLVHRSQHDPLVADEDANQMVLKELPAAGESSSTRLATQRECGIYFDDDYDYMQHVREREEGGVVWEAVNPTRPGQVVLPTCVLPSAVEEPVGMLNLAAPRGLDLSLDPDIVAALDDDFDFGDPSLELEDDFIEMAEGAVRGEYGDEGAGYSGEYYGSEEEYCDSEEGDEVNSLFSNEGSEQGSEQGCRFTEYSVSSSVLPRNEGLTMLDNRFEEMYKEYDVLGAGEEDLRAVDELDGTTEPTMLLNHLCTEFERQNLSDEESVAYNKAKTLSLAQEQSEKPEKKESVVEEIDHRAAIAWDCETILSTYSNIYNHPKLIEIPSKIKLDKRGIAINDTSSQDKESVGEKENENKDICQSDEDDEERTVVISNYRTKSETSEEKRARKKAVKESQRMRRQIKKATKEVFKEEIHREGKLDANKQGKVIKL